MREGTKSVLLLGAHSPIHSLFVLYAWMKLYKRVKFWEIVCIFIHDIGTIGLDYISIPELKNYHWIKGALIALKLFGFKGYHLCAGHSSRSGYPRSKLYYADKMSYAIIPLWIIKWNSIIEQMYPDRKQTYHRLAINFQKAVRQSVNSGKYDSSHDLYLKNKKEGNIGND